MSPRNPTAPQPVDADALKQAWSAWIGTRSPEGSRVLARLRPTGSRPGYTVEEVTTVDGLDEVTRLRRRVYVDEMKLLAADHPWVAGDHLRDPYDAWSHQLLLRADGVPVGTLRMTVGVDGDLEIEAYTDASPVLRDDRNAAEVTRMMVTRSHRRGPGARLMLYAAWRLSRERRVERGLCAAKLGNLGRYYRNFGFDCVSEEPFTYDVVGDARYQLLSTQLGLPGSAAWLRWAVVMPALRVLAFHLPAIGERWFRRGFARTARA